VVVLVGFPFAPLDLLVLCLFILSLGGKVPFLPGIRQSVCTPPFTPIREGPSRLSLLGSPKTYQTWGPLAYGPPNLVPIYEGPLNPPKKDPVFTPLQGSKGDQISKPYSLSSYSFVSEGLGGLVHKKAPIKPRLQYIVSPWSLCVIDTGIGRVVPLKIEIVI